MDVQSVPTARVAGSARSVVNSAREKLKIILSDDITFASLLMILFIFFLGVAGPYLAPYDYSENMRNEQGELLTNEPPSLAHPLGTTNQAQDVLSRVLYGARPTLITGLIGGSMIIGIGMTIGVTAGYIGGTVDNILMRFTDMIYSIPILPFALALVALLQLGFLTTVLIIGCLLWRGNARILRSQTLQIKERAYIRSAKATGAGRFHIIRKHILPNIASMAVLFFALGIGYSILLESSLSFLGVTNPFVPTWGLMVKNAFDSGYMDIAWWWSVTPGLLISLTVMSMIMFGRGYERVVGVDIDVVE